MKKNITIVFNNSNSKNYDMCLMSLANLCKDGIELFVINGFGETLYNNIHYVEAGNNGIQTINKVIQQCLQAKNAILFVDNRAILGKKSLDEMLFQLELTEKNGIICSRSEFADREIIINFERNETLANQFISDDFQKLDRFSILPIVESLPVLIKYQAFLICGLLDDSTTCLTDAIDEFSLRINQYGYSTVRANYGKSFCFDIEDVFGLEKKIINEKIVQKYPYINQYLPMYLNYGVTASEHFSNFLTSKKGRIKLLYSLYELPSFYNGTSQHALFLLDAFYKLFSNKYDIYILINKEADCFFDISSNYNNVFYPEEITGYYDIVYVPGQIFHIQHLFLINKIALKFVFDVQDIISMRCDYINGTHYIQKMLFHTALQFCDGFTTLSKFVDEDTRNYYFDIFHNKSTPSKCVYLTHTINKSAGVDNESNITPFSDYIVVFGNDFKHKNIDNLVEVISKSKYNYVIIGAGITGFLKENIYGLKSGNISEHALSLIMNNSKAFLFPSVYEGFGLPIFNALMYEKHIVVYNSALNQELIDFLKEDGKYVISFESLNEVEACLDKAIVGSKDHKIYYKRDWKDVANEVEIFIGDIVNNPIDFQSLELRWKSIKAQEFFYKNNDVSGIVSNSQNDIQTITMKDLLKLYLQTNYPKVFMKLTTIKNWWRRN